MDKNIIKETMLSLEGAALQSAREKSHLGAHRGIPGERPKPRLNVLAALPAPSVTVDFGPKSTSLNLSSLSV
jgi:hypothetical protein